MELTKAEEQIMQILWKIKKGFVKDILENYDNPKPAYTTVATITKILEKKGFVKHESLGNAHRFYPVVKRETYKKGFAGSVFQKYFKGSIKDVVSFFADNNDITTEEIDGAIEMLNQLKKQKS